MRFQMMLTGWRFKEEKDGIPAVAVSTPLNVDELYLCTLLRVLVVDASTKDLSGISTMAVAQGRGKWSNIVAAHNRLYGILGTRTSFWLLTWP